VTNQHFNDPVAAYEHLGSRYAELCKRREAYLRSVEKCILERIPAGSQSLLDIGAGDGSRAMRIAAAAAIRRLVLVEPGAGMIRAVASKTEIWPFRAEELSTNSLERFDVITCLWNVLGHVRGTEARRRALTNAARMLSSRGKLFIDVNHRYNGHAYGMLRTTARWLRDHLVPDESAGDVTATWDFGDSTISTYGHVFTHREMMRLAKAAGLALEERITIDYDDGRSRRWPFAGNLLYIFRRNSPIDSSSAPQTS